MSGKIFLGVLIVFFSTVFGRIKADKYRRKMDFLLAIEDFAVYLKREISFSSNTVDGIIGNFQTENLDALSLLKSWLLGTAVYPQFLSLQERQVFKMFFDKIGRSNRENEIDLISSFSTEIKSMKEIENEKCLKKSNVATKLGFFIGAIIFVVVL